jgi:hypothetical protein
MYRPLYRTPKSPNGSRLKKILTLMMYLLVFGLIGYLLHGMLVQNYTDQYDKFYDPKLDMLKDRIATAIPEINRIEISGSNKSFTINKKSVYICTKDENGSYYEDNMLIYVILHELAHVLCDEVGHTEKFKSIFRSLLERATKAGVYNPATPPIDDYCNY